MAEPVGYRVRLRVRLTKALNTEDASRVISLGGREVTIVSQTPDQRLSEALWIIFRGQGFSSEAEPGFAVHRHIWGCRYRASG